MQTLTEETEALRSSLDEGKTSREKERQTLKQQIDEIARIRDTDVRIATLRQELDERQGQRTEVTEQNAKLAERSTQLEKRLNEMAAAVQSSEERIRELDEEKVELQKDLDKIMANLTRR